MPPVSSANIVTCSSIVSKPKPTIHGETRSTAKSMSFKKKVLAERYSSILRPDSIDETLPYVKKKIFYISYRYIKMPDTCNCNHPVNFLFVHGLRPRDLLADAGPGVPLLFLVPR